MICKKIIFLICFTVWMQVVSAQETIRIAIGEWQPILSKHAPHYGFAAHVITEAFARQGIQVEYGFYPWKRAYLIAKEGVSWDGTAVWLHNEERAKDFYYSDPVVPTTVSFFHLVDVDFDWESIEDLGDTKIGVTSGYSYGPEFDSAVKTGEMNAEESRTDRLNLQKLLRGRIEAFPGEVAVMYSLIRELFSPETAARFTHHPKALLKQPQHLLISKADPDNERWIREFNTGLKKLKESGRYDRIMEDSVSGQYASQK